MIRQRLLRAGLLIAVISVAVSSGDAEARCRCRGGRFAGGGWSQGNNYAYNTGSSYYAGQNGYSNGNQSGYSNGNQSGYSNGTVVNPGMNAVNPGVNTAPVNAPINAPSVQTNGNYSVGRPVYTTPPAQGQQIAPPQTNQIQSNSSPDPDNEGRNASKIPGTAPTKAPAPAADATP